MEQVKKDNNKELELLMKLKEKVNEHDEFFETVPEILKTTSNTFNTFKETIIKLNNRIQLLELQNKAYDIIIQDLISSVGLSGKAKGILKRQLTNAQKKMAMAEAMKKLTKEKEEKD